MELGGLDPFMVMLEANVDKAVELALRSRTTNCGQVCFSAKRFIVHKHRYEEFSTKLVAKLEKIKVGDPTLESTNMGPLARWDFVGKLHKQL
jgi:acyl-CoA reductase-like NAD-dependent aldehyde dehydrogenase